MPWRCPFYIEFILNWLPVMQLFANPFGKKKAPAPKRVVRETVIPEPALNLPAALVAISGLSAYEENLVLAAFTGVLAAFLAFQSTRVR